MGHGGGITKEYTAALTDMTWESEGEEIALGYTENQWVAPHWHRPKQIDYDPRVGGNAPLKLWLIVIHISVWGD